MVHKSTLDNGIRVVTERIPGAHSVAVGFWVENGSRHEDAAYSGISHFVEHMLFKGTERRSALDIAKEIDSVGGVLNAFTSREYSCYYAKVLARKLPLAVDLLSDIVLHSILDLDELEKERKVVLQEINMLEDTPDDLVHDLFSQTFWQGHPLGRSIIGTAETVERIGRKALTGFLAERYCGRNILVCAAGDLEHEQLVDHIAAAFRDLAAGCRPPASAPPVCFRSVDIVERDLEQVHLCLGTAALPQNHPERFTSYLLNAILGGSMSSRLFQKIREELGLAYSIYSYLNSHSDAGAMVLYAGTSPEDARRVVEIMLRELRRLKIESVSADELHFAREQLKGQLLLSLESTDNRMTRLAKNEIYLGRNPLLKEILGGFDRVTAEDILQLAGTSLSDDSLTLQLMGRVQQADFPAVDLTLG